MELTQEYFDQQLKTLATKQDLAAQTKELKAYTDAQIAPLATKQDLPIYLSGTLD